MAFTPYLTLIRLANSDDLDTDALRVCGSCGSEWVQAEEPSTCPSCGAALQTPEGQKRLVEA